MVAIWANFGERWALARGLESWTGFQMHLFQNNLDPDDDTVLADFTQASFSGYTPVTISFPLNGTITVAGEARLQASPANFQCAPTIVVGNSIYGYYITQESGTQLIYSERFSAAPFLMDSPGAVLTVVTTAVAKSLF